MPVFTSLKRCSSDWVEIIFTTLHRSCSKLRSARVYDHSIYLRLPKRQLFHIGTISPKPTQAINRITDLPSYLCIRNSQFAMFCYFVNQSLRYPEIICHRHCFTKGRSNNRQSNLIISRPEARLRRYSKVSTDRARALTGGLSGIVLDLNHAMTWQ